MTAAFLLSWLAVSAAMSLLIAAAAVIVQRLASRAVPARVVWAGAMLAMLGVTATQPLRRAPLPMAVAGPDASLPIVEGVSLAARSSIDVVLVALRDAPAAALDGLVAQAGTAGRRLSPAASRLLMVLWPVASGALSLILLLSYRRQRDLLRRTRQRTVAGALVHVSEQTGPAVIGAAEPAIVVPQWLLDRTEDEQQLVVAHESAHIAARDPQLLLAGCAAVALMPWNPAAWFALARLRLAIELDCDARVLAHGTDTRRYGQLLIELSAAAPHPAIPPGAPAFSYRASHLERRLRTMTARPARFLAARRVSALLIGSAALLAACGAELPTAAEVERMDVATVESKLGRMVPLDSSKTRFIVDGKVVEERLARDLSADSISTIEVRKGAGELNEIRIVTGRPLNGNVAEGRVMAAAGDSQRVKIAIGKPMNGAPSGRVVLRTPGGVGADPLFIIDGKKSGKADLDKLSPNAIESIEVLKGTSGVALYGPEAANGVVVVRLRK